eukprot:403353267
MHKKQMKDKVLAFIIYLKAFYTQYIPQHVKIHHKMVATTEDTTTSYLGESVNQFFLRTVSRTFKAAWKIEFDRLTREGKSPYDLFNNTFIQSQICHIALFLTIYWIFGTYALTYHLIHSIVVISMQEGVNYLQHYGLMRKKDSQGIYESVKMKHSWDAPYFFTNYMLFKNERHADHHTNSYKPYQMLSAYPENPTLPFGNAISLPMAFITPLWQKVINPIAIAFNKDEKIDVKILEQNEKIKKIFITATSIVFTILCFGFM